MKESSDKILILVLELIFLSTSNGDLESGISFCYVTLGKANGFEPQYLIC